MAQNGEELPFAPASVASAGPFNQEAFEIMSDDAPIAVVMARANLMQLTCARRLAEQNTSRRRQAIEILIGLTHHDRNQESMDLLLDLLFKVKDARYGQYLQMACLRGNEEAKLNLALLQLNDENALVTSNPQMALHTLRDLWNGNGDVHIRAGFHLAQVFLSGIPDHIPSNKVEALHILETIIGAEDPSPLLQEDVAEAGFFLVDLYLTGSETYRVEKSVEKAFIALRKLAKTSTSITNGRAEEMLAEMWETGAHGQRDIGIALEWYYRALEGGDVDEEALKEKVDQLETHST